MRPFSQFTLASWAFSLVLSTAFLAVSLTSSAARTVEIQAKPPRETATAAVQCTSFTMRCSFQSRVGETSGKIISRQRVRGAKVAPVEQRRTGQEDRVRRKRLENRE